MPAEDGHHRAGQRLPELCAKLEPVHKRHADVGQHDIGPERQRQRQRLFAVSGAAGLVAQPRPVDARHQRLPEHVLVLDNQQFVHGHTLPEPIGILSDFARPENSRGAPGCEVLKK
jgi:hypothetical protein